MKETKPAVEYSRGRGESRCGNCIFFEKQSPGQCTKVQGAIEPYMWCLRFQAPKPGEIL